MTLLFWLLVWGSSLETRVGQLKFCLQILTFRGVRCLKRVEVSAFLAHASFKPHLQLYWAPMGQPGWARAQVAASLTEDQGPLPFPP